MCSSNEFKSLRSSENDILPIMSSTNDLLFSLTRLKISSVVYVSLSLRHGGSKLMLRDIGYSGLISILIST